MIVCCFRHCLFHQRTVCIIKYGVIDKEISLAVELRTFSRKTKYICAVWSMGYYTFDLLPLTTIHVIEFWLAKIIWAGQAFFAEPNSLKIRLLNKATDNTRNYGTIMGEWFACFVPCIFSNTVTILILRGKNSFNILTWLAK